MDNSNKPGISQKRFTDHNHSEIQNYLLAIYPKWKAIRCPCCNKLIRRDGKTKNLSANIIPYVLFVDDQCLTF